MMISGQIFPQGSPGGMVLAFIGGAIVVGDSFLIEYMLRLITMGSPYWRVDLEPGKETLHCFLSKRPESKEQKTNLWHTRLTFRWPVQHPYYGTINELVIWHEMPLSERIGTPGPGWAFFKGYSIEHPSVTHVVCHKFPKSADQWQGKKIPAFMLAYAHGGDVYRVPLPLTKILNAIPENLQKEELPRVFASLKRLETSEATFNDLTRQLNYYRNKADKLELAEGSHESEVNALQDDKMDFNERVFQSLLSWRSQFSDFDEAVKAKQGPWKGIFNKWFLMTMAIISGVMVIAFKPELAGGAGAWIEANRTFIIICLVIMGFIVYFLTRKFRGKK